MNLISIENKAAKLKLNDIVMQPVMDKLIADIGKVFGANAAENGTYTGELTNCFENAADTLDIEIHSPGGSVMDGYVLFNELNKLRQRGVFVTAHINTLAASMASVIAMAADKITMAPGGRMMIHEVSQGVRGNADELAKASKMCDQMSDEIAEIYSNRSGLSKAVCRGMMREETWMSGPEAKKLGFIDEIITDSQNLTIDDNATLLQKQNNDMSFIQKLLAPSNEEITSQLEAVKVDLADTEAKLADATVQISTAEAALQEAATEIQTLRTASVSMATELSEIKAEKDTLATSLAEAEAKITPEAIQALVTAQIAASGHPPLNVENGSEPNGNQENTITRAQFDTLSQKEKNAFFKKPNAKLID